MDRDELKDEIDRELARLGAATDGLAPDPGLVDAVLEAAGAARAAGDPLAGIARATSSIDAGEALAGAVVARAGREEEGGPIRSTSRPTARARGDAATAVRTPGRAGGSPSWADGVVRTGPIAVGLAALAAAASFLLFLSTQREADAALVSSVDIVEVSE